MIVFFHLTHLQLHTFHLLRQGFSTLQDGHILRVENQCLASLEKLHLLSTLDAITHKILLMRCTQVGHDTNGGFHDTFQFRHLSGLRNTCLDNGEVMMRIDEPHAQRHTHLTVIAAR